MSKIENQRSVIPRNQLLRQFRLSTLFWIILVVSAFLAGRYSVTFLLPPSPTQRTMATTWSPTFSPTIAIAGPIDIDGDGTDDLDKLKLLIANNGGTVVAFQDATGTVHGKIDAATQYIVIGDQKTAISTTNKLVLDAQRNSVQQISIASFLKKLGVDTNTMPDDAGGFKRRK